MFMAQTIVENAVNSADQTTLVADVRQSNGVIHLIDTVLPPAG